MDQLKELMTALPMTNAERQWVTEQMGFLSVKEHYQLWAALQRRESLYGLLGKQGDALLAEVLQRPPSITVDAINCLLELPYYEVCYPAGSYEELGEYYLLYEAGAPASVLPYTELKAVGQRYAALTPGLFLDGCYVTVPYRPLTHVYNRKNTEVLDSRDWSLRLKLASAAHADGVWLRLPDYSSLNDSKPDEIALALRELKAESLQECTLLDAKCSLPKVQNLMDQYNSLEDLVRDGNDLGFLLDERGQGTPGFEEKFAAVLEFENCYTLKLALDLGQNLSCYDFLPAGDIAQFGRDALAGHGSGDGEPLILFDCIDYRAYGASLLEQSGYNYNADRTFFIRRNGQKPRFERTSPEGPEMTLRL